MSIFPPNTMKPSDVSVTVVVAYLAATLVKCPASATDVYNDMTTDSGRGRKATNLTPQRSDWPVPTLPTPPAPHSRGKSNERFEPWSSRQPWRHPKDRVISTTRPGIADEDVRSVPAQNLNAGVSDVQRRAARMIDKHSITVSNLERTFSVSEKLHYDVLKDSFPSEKVAAHDPTRTARELSKKVELTRTLSQSRTPFAESTKISGNTRTSWITKTKSASRLNIPRSVAQHSAKLPHEPPRTRETSLSTQQSQDPTRMPEPTTVSASPWAPKTHRTQTSAKASSEPAESPEPSSAAANADEPKEEIDLRIGPEEAVMCSSQTEVDPPGNKPILTAGRFYRELYALKGSVVGEFRKDQLQNLNMSLSCVLSGNRFPGMYCCYLRLRVPAGSYIAVEFLNKAGLYLNVFDAKWKTFYLNQWEKLTENRSLAYVASSNVVYVLQSEMPSCSRPCNFRFRFRFFALDSPGLQVIYTSWNRGVVQTPLQQHQPLLATKLLEPWASVKVPSGHVIMVRPPPFEIHQCVALYAGDRPRREEALAKMCYQYAGLSKPLFTSVYDTSELLVHVYKDSVNDNGFQLHFSFHNLTALPVKLDPGDHLWNCSVPYASDFLYHLSCNLEVECQDAADERGCSYTTDHCGPGYLMLGGGGGSCFFYARRRKAEISWAAASVVCSLRGGRLAVLNSDSKTQDALNMLPHNAAAYVGIRTSPASLPMWYGDTYQYADETMAFHIYSESSSASNTSHTGLSDSKSPYRENESYTVGLRRSDKPPDPGVYLHVGCIFDAAINILCEKLPAAEPSSSSSNNNGIAISINGTQFWQNHTAYAQCSLGHYTHRFLVCDAKSSCGFRDSSSRCGGTSMETEEASHSTLSPLFTCATGAEHYPYTLICDHIADCGDGSDEDFCRFPQCQAGRYTCQNRQCIPWTGLCDGWENCFSREDEDKCHLINADTHPPPAQIVVHSYGQLHIVPFDSPHFDEEGAGPRCPSTHFQCHNDGYCIPVFFRCNGVYDCLGREDEADCESCPGFYRCRASQVCVHHDSVCDGYAHCPQHDDEMLCYMACPTACRCVGLAFFCGRVFTASAHPLLRFLDATGSGVSPARLAGNALLIHLSLADCGLARLDGLFLPNLLSLRVSDNQLNTVGDVRLGGVPQLRDLSLAGNPLSLVFAGVDEPRSFPSLHDLDLSKVSLRDLNATALTALPNLQVLNLSHSGVRRVLGEGLRSMKQLRVIDLRSCPMTWIPSDMFQGLSHLQTVHAGNFKVCCPEVLPRDFVSHNCFAPSDEISSCANLLRGNVYSVSVFVLSFLALVGNAVSFVFRTHVLKRENKVGYSNFVTHLSVSDFLMGVYLAVIGVADQVYHGTYMWNDVLWKHSIACKMAGFLSLLSSEVSALIMCLITLDRFLVLHFPFSRRHFSPSSAHLASVATWVAGVFVASVPLLPVTSHWEFYSQTGICIPLPVTKSEFSGRSYAFGIVVVFNFVVFVFISVGQLSIYWSVRINSMSVSSTSKKTKDLTIARRLLTVAMTDFLCWFPIGVLGLVASSGVPVPGEFNVAAAIFVLPLNAAVNPCLYTYNVIMERWSREREEKLRNLLLTQLKIQ